MMAQTQCVKAEEHSKSERKRHYCSNDSLDYDAVSPKRLFTGCAPGDALGDAPAGRPLAVASAPPHRPSPSRASLATAEARCGGGGGAEEVMIVVCCSDSSCADANAGELAPLSCVRCAGKGWRWPKGQASRLRSPWYTPDLVSDLPEGCPAALDAAGLRPPRRCADCRCETWRRAQVLLRRPESAPGPGPGCAGEGMDAGAGGGGGERIVCAPVKDRIQIFNGVAAAPRSRPVSAQRSVELELGPSTTRVKERILAFNAGVLPAPDASAAPAPAPAAAAAAAAAHCQPPPPGPLRGQAHPGVASRAAAAAEGTAPEPGPPPPPPDAPRVSPANSATSLSSSESSREGRALALVAEDASESESSVDKAALLAHDAGRRCAVSMALAAVAAASLWYAYN